MHQINDNNEETNNSHTTSTLVNNDSNELEC